jgi:hypothetical protein
MDKHMLYHDLVECLEIKVCPVCAMTARRVRQYLEGFLYESVNDYNLRGIIRDAGGYCPEHSRELQKLGDPLAHAIIYGNLLKDQSKDMKEQFAYLKAIKGNKHDILRPFKFKRAIKKENILDKYPAPVEKCPVCKLAEDGVNMYTDAVVEYLKEDETYRDAFGKKSYLCNTHLRKALKMADQDTCLKLLAIHIDKVDTLRNYLEETKRKSDYRFCNEFMPEEEKKAWISAVKLWAGEL